MTGEHPAPYGVLRQTVTTHFQPVTLLASVSGGDVMSASTVVSKPIGALSTVHGPEITQERLELTNGGDRVTRLHPPAIIGLRSDTHECVEGSLTAHFLKGIPDVGVDENSRVVGVLGLPRQIMEHVEQLRTPRGPILKATRTLHKIGIGGGEISVGSVARVVVYEPSCASTPDGAARKRSDATVLFEKSKEEAPREFGQKLWEKFPQDVWENEFVNNQFMKLGIVVLEQAANVFAPTPPVNIRRAKRWARMEIFANFRNAEPFLLDD